MATYGDIRLSVAKQAPGIDPELIDGFILGVYQEILDTMSWSRQKGTLTLQTPAEFNAGTLTATLGSQIVVGDGSFAWTAALTGRVIRIAAGQEFYQFTYQDPTTGLLDRPYEGQSAGAGQAYRINQTVYPLPANVRLVEAVRNLDAGWELNRATGATLNLADASRDFYGSPCYWAPTFDQQSNPPQAQIEIYPVPDQVYAVAVDCVFEDTAFGTGSSSPVAVWMRPDCLKAGARALCEAHQENYTGAAYWDGRFKQLLAQMVGVESMRIGPQTIRMASRFTRHRVNRVTNLSSYRTLPN